MTQVILIRHANTDYNSENRYCGFTNPSINADGLAQCKKLAHHLKKLKIDAVYSSDLKRARETARIIFKGSDIKKSKAFREINFGIFEGLKYDEIIERYPKLYKDWVDDPVNARVPGAETLEELAKRVRKKLVDIVSRHKNRKIALITHGGPIRVILCGALRLGLEMFWKIGQDAGEINIINYEENVVLPPPRCLGQPLLSNAGVEEPHSAVKIGG